MSQSQVLAALDLLKAGDLHPGQEMEDAHRICQEHEGDAIFDWVHALVHRIEGDNANAGYWYRRAGRNRHPGSVAEEWHLIRTTVEGA